MEETLRINKKITTLKLRVIDQDGEQLGILSRDEALNLAVEAGLDLVEIVPKAVPPVCKIIDYGKYRYDQTKREKENLKAQHQIKVKEIKLKPNTDEHDIEFKLKHVRDFLEKGNKVKITCTFRGREMMHPQIGEKMVQKMCEAVEDLAIAESPMKMMGKTLTTVLAPHGKKITKPASNS
ncbi:MAG: infC [Chlamydiales bacterium]|nr:infC [Chlamydiales bacterium]